MPAVGPRASRRWSRRRGPPPCGGAARSSGTSGGTPRPQGGWGEGCDSLTPATVLVVTEQGGSKASELISCGTHSTQALFHLWNHRSRKGWGRPSAPILRWGQRGAPEIPYPVPPLSSQPSRLSMSLAPLAGALRPHLLQAVGKLPARRRLGRRSGSGWRRSVTPPTPRGRIAGDQSPMACREINLRWDGWTLPRPGHRAPLRGRSGAVAPGGRGPPRPGGGRGGPARGTSPRWPRGGPPRWRLVESNRIRDPRRESPVADACNRWYQKNTGGMGRKTFSSFPHVLVGRGECA